MTETVVSCFEGATTFNCQKKRGYLFGFSCVERDCKSVQQHQKWKVGWKGAVLYSRDLPCETGHLPHQWPPTRLSNLLPISSLQRGLEWSCFYVSNTDSLPRVTRRLNRHLPKTKGNKLTPFRESVFLCVIKHSYCRAHQQGLRGWHIFVGKFWPNQTWAPERQIRCPIACLHPKLVVQ